MVVSALIDLVSRCGETRLWSIPSARSLSSVPRLPRACCSHAGLQVLRSPTVVIPWPWSTSVVFGPTPDRMLTSSGARKACSTPVPTSSSPFGLASWDETLATVLDDPPPMLTTRPISFFTLSLSSLAMSLIFSLGTSALMSRYASSKESGSTRGVRSRKMFMTMREISWYRSKRGGSRTRLGHSRMAVRMGMAEWILYSRAS